jgi:hypothetical protein
VPTASVFEFEGESYVRVVTAGAETRVPVVRGTQQGDWTVVQAAELQAGDQVLGQVPVASDEDSNEMPAGPGMMGGPPPQ